MECSICYDPVKVAAKIQCNHIFCDDCLRSWKTKKMNCPVCRKILPPSLSYRTRRKIYGDDVSNLLSFWRELHYSEKTMEMMKIIITMYQYLFPLQYLDKYIMHYREFFICQLVHNTWYDIFENEKFIITSYYINLSLMDTTLSDYAEQKKKYKNETLEKIRLSKMVEKCKTLTNILSFYYNEHYQNSLKLYQNLFEIPNSYSIDESGLDKISFSCYKKHVIDYFEKIWQNYERDIKLDDEPSVEVNVDDNGTIDQINDVTSDDVTIVFDSIENKADMTENFIMSNILRDEDTEDSIYKFLGKYSKILLSVSNNNTFWTLAFDRFSQNLEWFITQATLYHFFDCVDNFPLIFFFHRHGMIINNILKIQKKIPSRLYREWKIFEEKIKEIMRKKDIARNITVYEKSDIVDMCIENLVEKIFLNL